MKWLIETYARVNSTQDIVKGLGALGKPEGTVIQAYQQSGGHGRHGRPWVSDAGNLYLSALLRPSCPVSRIGEIGLVAGVAVLQALLMFVSDAALLSLKWPNDVLINKKKCAGILIETENSNAGAVDFAVLGVGINIAHAPRDIAVCLNDFTRSSVQVDEIRNVFLQKLDDLYELWRVKGFDELKKLWLAYGPIEGERVKVGLGEQIVQGSFRGLDDQGGLILQGDDFGLKVITAGDIYT